MIKTSQDLTGFAPVKEGWIAYDASTYDGAGIPQIAGFGSTEVEAVLDLVERVIDMWPDDQKVFNDMNDFLIISVVCEHLIEAVRNLKGS